jgi:ABC-type antimicrobial peptide transport system permease subunit
VPVSHGFLDALGIAILRGRGFDRSEINAAAGVAILSQSAARQVAPDGDALGSEVRTFGRKPATVIGICRDAVDYGALSKAGTYAPSELYVPYESPAITNEAIVLARTSTDPHSTLRAIAAAAQIPATERPARPVILSEDLGRRDIGSAMVVVNLLSAFAVLTLMLAASGVFSVISQSVAQRTREFGIRLALGATRGRVTVLVLRDVSVMLVIGCVVGASTAAGLSRVVEGLLFGVTTTDPAVFLFAIALLAAASFAAAYAPARRAARVDPIVALRHE